MKKVIPLLFLLGTLSMNAQKEANIWYFGNYAGLDFNTGSPVVLTDGKLSTNEGCATISDKTGNLLFYTDGITVHNSLHAIMQNGTGLKGDPSSTHSAIIVPKPGSSTVYYIFTLDALSMSNVPGADGLHYSEVDMSLDGGAGAVTTKNIPLHTPLNEKLTAIKKPGSDEYWVVAHKYDSFDFLTYNVTSAGVDPIPIVSTTGSYRSFRTTGQIKISPDGTKLAVSWTGDTSEVFDFDMETGTVGDQRVYLEPPGMPYGIEFSPDGNILYVSSYGGVLQYDLLAGSSEDVENSMVRLYWSGNEAFSSLQLGPDRKIYVAKVGSAYIDVIDAPNVLGPGCGYRYDGIFLDGMRSRLGLPTFVSSFFSLGSIEVKNICYGAETEFYLKDTVDSVVWDFGDPASGADNTSTDLAPKHIFSSAGRYSISITATTDGQTVTESREIDIYDAPVAHVPVDYEVCSPLANYRFDLSTKDDELLGAQSSGPFDISYHSTASDSRDGTNALPVLYTNSDPVEPIYARIFNRERPECYALATFDLVIKDSPVPGNAMDWSVCDTDMDGSYVFDLSLKDVEVLGGRDAGIFNVTYYLSRSDAESGMAAIGPNYTNSVPTEEIFYRAENGTSPECYMTGSFHLEVLDGVTAHTATPYEVCDTDNDGFAQFDLSTRDMEFIGSQNPSSIGISYHSTQADAENRTAALDKNSYDNRISYRETVFVRVENSFNTDCYDIATLALLVHDSPVPQEVADWTVCDTDNDGLYFFDLSEKDHEILGDQNRDDLSITYHESEQDALAGRNAILGPYRNTLDRQTIYYRSENRDNRDCFVMGSFMIGALNAPTAHPPTDIVVCDVNGNGTMSFDLSARDGEVLNGQDPHLFEVAYFGNREDADNDWNALSRTAYANTALQETIFARIRAKALEQCSDIVSFSLTVNPLPQPDIGETYVICPDSPDLILDGGDFETWEWADGQGTILGRDRIFEILDVGVYGLRVGRTTNGVRCESTVSFEVVPSGAPDDFTYVINGFSDRVSLTIDAIGNGEFEYSIDGKNFQDGNGFEVFPGEYTVHVRDRYLCRTISRTIMALGYQKFFTPNGDGVNEYWNVIGGDGYPGSVVHIYDRYGKLLKRLSPESRGWDGIFEGRQMPSTDYWFRYIYGDGKSVTGHFSLKR